MGRYEISIPSKTNLQSWVSSKWNLTTDSESCQFQISYFNIAGHPGSHTQKARDGNILAVLLPFLGLLGGV